MEENVIKIPYFVIKCYEICDKNKIIFKFRARALHQDTPLTCLAIYPLLRFRVEILNLEEPHIGIDHILVARAIGDERTASLQRTVPQLEFHEQAILSTIHHGVHFSQREVVIARLDAHA